MTRIAKGLGALLVLVGAILCVPLLLVAVGGTEPPSWDTLVNALTVQDFTGTVLSGALVIVGWILWATFTICVVLEVARALAGARVPRLPALGPQQRAAAGLVAAVIALMAVPSVGTAPAHAAPAATTVTAPAAVTPPAATAVAQTTPTTTPAADDVLEVTVRSGDTLWDLAEHHLGDGQKWRDIATANYDRTQPGGAHLGDDNLLEPGWTLTIPGATTQASVDTVTVERGDTLWGIADEHLGDGARYDELTRVDHPHADPDLIWPGEHVSLPGSAEQATATPVAPPQRPTQVEATPPIEAAPPTPPPADVTPPTTVDDPVDDTTFDDVEESAPADLRTIGGVSLILAAGIVGALALRRRRQTGQRAAGQRIALPAPETGTTEAALRAIEDRDAASDLTSALALLATSAATPPAIRFTHLTPDRVEIILDEPAQLATPWAPSDAATCWSVARTDLTPPAAATIRPYPSLVSLGDTADGNHLLVDLESIGSLTISGPRAIDALTALATELATSSHDATLRVTFVGFGADLADTLGPDVAHVDHPGLLLEALEARARDLTRALGGPTPLPLARRDGVVDDAAPHLVFVGRALDEATAARLDELTTRVPRLGIAAVALDEHTAARADFHLEVDDDESAVLKPVGLRVRPQLLGGAELEHVIAVLAATAAPATPGPDWAASIPNLPAVTIPEELPDEAPDEDETSAEERDERAPTDAIGEDGLESARGDQEPSVADEAQVDVREDLDDAPVKSDYATAAARTATAIGSITITLPDTRSPASEADELDDEPTSADPVVPAPAGGVDPEKRTAVAAFLGGKTSPPAHDSAPLERAVASPPSKSAFDHEARAAIASFLGGKAGPVHELRREHPRVLVLGPTSVEGATGPEPATSNGTKRTSSHTRQATLAIAYLTLLPGRAKRAEQLAEQLAVGGRRLQPQTITARLSRARAWLGQDPDGTPYLPVKAADEPYAVNPQLGCDWHELLALIGDDITQTPLPDLRQALDLVRDRPFVDVNACDIPWAEELRTEMTQTIADLAHVAASRALSEHNLPLARLAVAKGRRIDDTSQDLWADAIELELLSGRLRDADRLAHDLQAWADDADLALIDHAQAAIATAHDRAATA